MLGGFAIALLLAPLSAWAGDAPVVSDNPLGAQYIAEMPATGDKGVIASFSVRTIPDDLSVEFAINVNGAEFSGGPFRKPPSLHWNF